MSYCCDYSDDSDMPYDCNERSYERCRSCGTRWETDGDDLAIDTCPNCCERE
jgi:hypothetical protein